VPERGALRPTPEGEIRFGRVEIHSEHWSAHANLATGKVQVGVNGFSLQEIALLTCNLCIPSNPGESCSYLAQTYRSHCSQVYNYHRLLSWDKVRGLHVDIFKVPTCCSCQVDGYRQQFPPLSSIQAKDYSPLANTHANHNGYSTINEEDLDYADESEEDELGLRYPSLTIGRPMSCTPAATRCE